MQFKRAKEDLKSLSLQQNPPSRWKHIAALIRFQAIDPDGNLVEFGQAR